MDTLSYKTVSANSATANKEWVVVDAADMIVGRLASAVAKILRGKHKPNFTPHADCGDNVIVINAEKVRFSGKKMTDKIYLRHTGYPGGQRSQNPADVFAKYPERVVESAVRGMLPKNRLGRKVFGNMKVYVGAEHKQEAQNPKVIDLKKIKL
ncbi:50S ribosomal protein L13 [Sunxiuqinia indica]|uniref:50S ribosomal protein L13 n=1 Tax=Sunxiuqinia indica TaxID=2692584 RepID=UPI00135B8135|nr:50S ribosomal protein L13 [Sunxiuqinia indica]